MVKVLLDTTYLLPSFGIKVKGLTSDDLLVFRRLLIERVVEFYCIPVILVELLGKVYRDSRRYGESIGDIIDNAFKSIMEAGYFKWIMPPVQALKIAFNLRTLGHRDIIDNILYATSLVNKMIFLSMDKNLKDFLEKHGYDTSLLKDHKEFFNELNLT